MTRLSKADGAETWDEPRFRAALTSIMDDAINEGFFAGSIVLVEGKEDKKPSVLETALGLLGFDIEAYGIALFL